MTSPTHAAARRGLPDAEAIAERYHLARVGVRPPLRDYLTSLWERRHFAFTLARARARSRTSQDRLGPLWNVLQPLFLAGTYLLLFGVLVGANRRVENYAGYLSVGVFVFHYTSQSVNAGARSLTGSNNLLRSLHFPRALMPIVATLVQLILFVPTLGVLLVLLVLTHERPSAEWLMIVPVLALQTCFNMGLGMIFARMAAHSHDFLQGLPFIMRLWFYMSGVFWFVERVAAYPVLRFIFEVNPGYVYIHLARDALLHDVPPADYPTWPLGVGWAVVTLGVGLVFIWRGEARFGRP